MRRVTKGITDIGIIAVTWGYEVSRYGDWLCVFYTGDGKQHRKTCILTEVYGKPQYCIFHNGWQIMVDPH